MKKELIILILLLAAAICQAQTDTTKTVLKQLFINGLTSSTRCDTCKYSFNTTGSAIVLKPKPYPDWTFYTEGSIVAKLSVKDSSGQQTGWFDKRYVKFTSDSTFVILPKSK